MFADYKDFQIEAVEQTGTGLRNATGSGQRCDSELEKFMNSNNISHHQESAKAFEDIQRRALLDASFDAYYQDIKAQEDEIANVVESWSVMQIPGKAKLIEETAQAVSKELTRLSTNAKLPKIEENSDTHVYSIVSYQRKVYKPRGAFQFREQLQDSGKISILGIIIMLIANAMVLFNYYVASRKETMQTLSNGFTNDNSISLK